MIFVGLDYSCPVFDAAEIDSGFSSNYYTYSDSQVILTSFFVLSNLAIINENVRNFTE